MSFVDQRSTSRPVKLAWIALIGGAFGFLFTEVVGVSHRPTWFIVIGTPIVVGLALGWVGIASDGGTRNRKAVLAIAAVVGLAIVSIMALFVEALLNSTDL